MAGAWSENPVWTSTATGTATIDSPDLGAFRELLVQVQGLRHNTATSAEFMIQVSADGVTYEAVDYLHGGSSGTTGLVFATGVLVTELISASIELLHFNVARQTWANIRGGRESNSTRFRTATGYHIDATAWRYIRITNVATPGPAASNFDANGGIAVYYRQP